MSVRCPYDYLCVIDFEATCRENDKEFYPHEIIEFPAVLISISMCEIVAVFHSFVKPVIYPELTNFCKKLTGITQESIDNADVFKKVLSKFCEWLSSYVKPEESLRILTDGSWDIGKFLCLQCLISEIKLPSWANNWIDMKRTYKYYHKANKVKLSDMLNSYGLQFKGRLHSGKDDARNIAQLALAMLSNGRELIANSSISPTNIKELKNKLLPYQKRMKNEKKKCTVLPVLKQEKHKRENFLGRGSYVETSMDIDPDLIGSEFILLKHKNKF